MDKEAELAHAGRDALEAGDATEAANAFLRLLRDEPDHAIWRLRYADALELRGDEDEAEEQRRQLMQGALEKGRPLHALAAAMAAGIEPLAGWFAECLATRHAVVSPTMPGAGGFGSMGPGTGGFGMGSTPPWLSGAEGGGGGRSDAPPYPSDDPERDPAPVPFLSLLDRDAFTAIEPSLSRRSMGPGEVLMAEGEQADAMYIVTAGRFEVVTSDPDRGRETVLAQIKEGTLVGEMALMLQRPRTATVRSLTEAETVRIDLDVVRRASESNRPLKSALTEYTSNRMLGILMASMPLFRDLPSEARGDILKRFKRREADAGETLVEQGMPGDGLRVVVSGQVSVMREVEGKPPTRVARLGPGQVFGEISLLTKQTTTATVIVTQPTSLLELAPWDFDDFCRKYPDLHKGLEELGHDRMAENTFLLADDEFFEDAE